MNEDTMYTVAFFVALVVGIAALGGWVYWLNLRAKRRNQR
ncbi:hypothetical protein J2Z69_002673 [Paenibacillus shirakamiensis]|uniref:Uncharacterized protein n=1 Tax=Paenibacillus shirakamiensis TaxID=1265935 RepID=A0ABS4JIV7_9BACL|nr:hypothetical protein [Paenibacillus shirakamiensis]